MLGVKEYVQEQYDRMERYLPEILNAVVHCDFRDIESAHAAYQRASTIIGGDQSSVRRFLMMAGVTLFQYKQQASSLSPDHQLHKVYRSVVQVKLHNKTLRDFYNSAKHAMQWTVHPDRVESYLETFEDKFGYKPLKGISAPVITPGYMQGEAPDFVRRERDILATIISDMGISTEPDGAELGLGPEDGVPDHAIDVDPKKAEQYIDPRTSTITKDSVINFMMRKYDIDSATVLSILPLVCRELQNMMESDYIFSFDHLLGSKSQSETSKLTKELITVLNDLQNIEKHGMGGIVESKKKADDMAAGFEKADKAFRGLHGGRRFSRSERSKGAAGAAAASAAAEASGAELEVEATRAAFRSWDADIKHYSAVAQGIWMREQAKIAATKSYLGRGKVPGAEALGPAGAAYLTDHPTAPTLAGGTVDWGAIIFTYVWNMMHPPKPSGRRGTKMYHMLLVEGNIEFLIFGLRKKEYYLKDPRGTETDDMVISRILSSYIPAGYRPSDPRFIADMLKHDQSWMTRNTFGGPGSRDTMLHVALKPYPIGEFSDGKEVDISTQFIFKVYSEYPKQMCEALTTLNNNGLSPLMMMLSGADRPCLKMSSETLVAVFSMVEAAFVKKSDLDKLRIALLAPDKSNLTILHYALMNYPSAIPHLQRLMGPTFEQLLIHNYKHQNMLLFASSIGQADTAFALINACEDSRTQWHAMGAGSAHGAGGKLNSENLAAMKALVAKYHEVIPEPVEQIVNEELYTIACQLATTNFAALLQLVFETKGLAAFVCNESGNNLFHFVSSNYARIVSQPYLSPPKRRSLDFLPRSGAHLDVDSAYYSRRELWPALLYWTPAHMSEQAVCAVNSDGHTPYSLGVKHRRTESLDLLLAAPTRRVFNFMLAHTSVHPETATLVSTDPEVFSILHSIYGSADRAKIGSLKRLAGREVSSVQSLLEFYHATRPAIASEAEKFYHFLRVLNICVENFPSFRVKAAASSRGEAAAAARAVMPPKSAKAFAGRVGPTEAGGGYEDLEALSRLYDDIGGSDSRLRY